jgi:hypothetical protein
VWRRIGRVEAGGGSIVELEVHWRSVGDLPDELMGVSLSTRERTAIMTSMKKSREYELRESKR